MPVPSKVVAQELKRVADSSYLGKTFYVHLVNDPGRTFADDSNFGTISSGSKIKATTSFTFAPDDIRDYAEGRRPLERQNVTFTHAGGTAPAIPFSHVAVSYGASNTSVGTDSATNTPTTITDQISASDQQDRSLVSVTKVAAPGTLSDGQTAVFYFDFTLYSTFIVD